MIKITKMRTLNNEALQEICGRSEIPWQKLIIKTWAYIKEKNLMQGQYVKPDDLLTRALESKEKMSLADITKRLAAVTDAAAFIAFT